MIISQQLILWLTNKQKYSEAKPRDLQITVGADTKSVAFNHNRLTSHKTNDKKKMNLVIPQLVPQQMSH
jgi:hypothetical protein